MEILIKNTSLKFQSVHVEELTIENVIYPNSPKVTDFNMVAGKTYYIKWVSASKVQSVTDTKRIFVNGDTSIVAYINLGGDYVKFEPVTSGSMVFFAGSTEYDLGDCVFYIKIID